MTRETKSKYTKDRNLNDLKIKMTFTYNIYLNNMIFIYIFMKNFTNLLN